MPAIVIKTQNHLHVLPFETLENASLEYEIVRAVLKADDLPYFVAVKSDVGETVISVLSLQSMSLETGEFPEWLMRQNVDVKLKEAKIMQRAQAEAQKGIAPIANPGMFA
ncbi:MAG: hypothetical protein P4M15_09480 [Alphaproteobacteria bacterium]|nr:hypothetical protein [Alphaproteobacteria bacterium]